MILRRLFGQLDRIEHKVNLLTQYVAQQGGRLMGLIDDLVADVTAQTTVIGSVETLLQNLSTIGSPLEVLGLRLIVESAIEMPRLGSLPERGRATRRIR